MSPGIIDYGVFLPRYRLPMAEYKKAVGLKVRGFKEKRVNDFDEDVITILVEAARGVLARQDPACVGYLGVATTSGPYDGRTMAGTLSAMLGLGNRVMSSEHTASHKAGLEALIMALDARREGLLLAGEVPVGKPRSPAEQASGAGGTAFWLGEEGTIVTMDAHASYVEERLGIGVRPRGEPDVVDLGLAGFSQDTYNVCVKGAMEAVLEKTGTSFEDYRFIVLPNPDGSSPQKLSRGLKLAEKADLGEVAVNLGDLGSAGPLVYLAHVLDKAEPGDRILVASFGPGSGSDAAALTVTAEVSKHPGSGLEGMLSEGQALDFFTYLKLRNLL